MSEEPKYYVEGFRTQDDAHPNRGSSVDYPADTVAEAKKRAKGIITEDFAKRMEMSEPLMYARVTNRFTGECVFDCFHKDHPVESND